MSSRQKSQAMDTDEPSSPHKSKRTHGSTPQEESSDVKPKKRHDDKTSPRNRKSEIPVSRHSYHSEARLHSDRLEKSPKHYGSTPNIQDKSPRRYYSDDKSPRRQYSSTDRLNEDKTGRSSGSKYKSSKDPRGSPTRTESHGDRLSPSRQHKYPPSPTPPRRLRPASTAIDDRAKRPSSRTSEPSSAGDYYNRHDAADEYGSLKSSSREEEDGRRRHHKSSSHLERSGSYGDADRKPSSRSRENLSGSKKSKHRTTSSKSMSTESIPRSASPARSDTSTGSTDKNKKLMLKLMIHEVRELKKQLDPNAPDVHIWQKKQKQKGNQPSGYDGSGSDLSDDGDSQDSRRRKRLLPEIPIKKVPVKKVPVRSFTKEERNRMLRTLKQ